MKNLNLFYLTVAIVMVIGGQSPVLAAGDSIFLFDRPNDSDRSEQAVTTDVAADRRAKASSKTGVADKDSATHASKTATIRPANAVGRTQEKSSSKTQEPSDEKAERSIDPQRP